VDEVIVTQTLRPTIGVSAPDEDQLAIEVGARGKSAGAWVPACPH
jgi:hypothetical protein